MNELAKKIEALLFVAGDGLSVSRIASILKKSDEEIRSAISDLEKHLESEHAITILKDQERASLVTAASVSKLVEDFGKEEFAGELTKAALEALTIVAYKGPMKRSEIDYIRGVNSSFMVRNLLMRGLIERVHNPKDSRAYMYRISEDFLKFFGLKSIADLPDYGAYSRKLEEFIKEGEATPESAEKN